MATKNILVFSAHPDDHISCAGTLLYLKDLGLSTTEVVFTNGESSVNKLKKAEKVNSKQLVTLRKAEFAKASKLLGTKKQIFLNQPNNGVVKSFGLVKQVMQIVRDIKPLIIIAENPNDYHVDHRAVGSIVTEGLDRAGWGVQKELGEPYKTPIGLYMGSLLEQERLDVLVDITKYWDTKLKLLECYGSQMGGMGFQLTEALAKYCGYKLRVPYAEGFQLMSSCPVKVSLLIEGLTNDTKSTKKT